MITIHQRYRRTDGRTDGRHAIPIPRICTKVHCAVNSLIFKHLRQEAKKLSRIKWYIAVIAACMSVNVSVFFSYEIWPHSRCIMSLFWPSSMRELLPYRGTHWFQNIMKVKYQNTWKYPCTTQCNRDRGFRLPIPIGVGDGEAGGGARAPLKFRKNIFWAIITY